MRKPCPRKQPARDETCQRRAKGGSIGRGLIGGSIGCWLILEVGFRWYSYLLLCLDVYGRWE